MITATQCSVTARLDVDRTSALCSPVEIVCDEKKKISPAESADGRPVA